MQRNRNWNFVIKLWENSIKTNVTESIFISAIQLATTLLVLPPAATTSTTTLVVLPSPSTSFPKFPKANKPIPHLSPDFFALTLSSQFHHSFSILYFYPPAFTTASAFTFSSRLCRPCDCIVAFFTPIIIHPLIPFRSNEQFDQNVAWRLSNGFCLVSSSLAPHRKSFTYRFQQFTVSHFGMAPTFYASPPFRLLGVVALAFLASSSLFGTDMASHFLLTALHLSPKQADHSTSPTRSVHAAKVIRTTLTTTLHILVTYTLFSDTYFSHFSPVHHHIPRPVPRFTAGLQKLTCNAAESHSVCTMWIYTIRLRLFYFLRYRHF